MDIQLLPFDRVFLELSWTWLNDPEIKALTLTPDFTREDQLAFFASLPERRDYHLWGVATNEAERIGAAGIKHVAAGSGEFWCYIGERAWWGRKLGPQILELCEGEARGLALSQLTMVADAGNVRSIRAFENSGFVLDPEQSSAGFAQLTKRIA